MLWLIKNIYQGLPFYPKNTLSLVQDSVFCLFKCHVKAHIEGAVTPRGMRLESTLNLLVRPAFWIPRTPGSPRKRQTQAEASSNSSAVPAF